MSIKYTSFESIKFSYIIDIMGACVGQKQIPQKRSTKRTSQQKFQTQIPRPQKAGPSKIDNQKGIVLSQKLRKMRQKFPSFWINPRKIKGQPKIKWEKMNENSYYKGQWKGNIMHGQGQVFINKNGQQRLAFVVFQEGRPQTSTVKILDSYGGYYEGPINQTLQPHGTGVYRNQEIGLVLQGQFLNGVPCGKIKQKCKQYVFEGQYKNGHKASGKMRDSKGEYQGDFAPASQKSQFFQDIKQGHGKYKWQNGGTYIGQWQCDSPHGVGKLYDAENSLVRKGKWYFGQMAAPQVTKNRPLPSKLIMNSL